MVGDNFVVISSWTGDEVSRICDLDFIGSLSGWPLNAACGIIKASNVDLVLRIAFSNALG